MEKNRKYKPRLLVILDGFGVSVEKAGNPVMEARTPALDTLWKNFPAATLQASGIGVGLPWGKAGNSEVGHLTIGAGKIIYNHLPRIENAVHDGSFEKNEAFLAALAHVKKNNSRFHIAGLCGNGSVHSYRNHLYALIQFAEKSGIQEIFIHAFTDGKDSPPYSGALFLKELEEKIAAEWPHTKIGTVVGRAYAMDRDENWNQTEITYRLMTAGEGKHVPSASEYLASSYKEGVTDTFIEPAIVGDENASGIIKEGDALIFFDFREDSVRQIVSAFASEELKTFERKKIQNLLVVTMTEYKKGFPVHVAFPPLDVLFPLAKVLSDAGYSHLHIAETEKYAHVTYFLNGGEERPFKKEERILIPSLETSHVDETPAMRAREVTDAIIERFYSKDVIIANLANADMVGHSGNYQAAIQAVEILDECIKRLSDEVLKTDGIMIVTADHGNIELKRNIQTGEKRTEHSLNPVPFILVAKNLKLEKERSAQEVQKVQTETRGILIDVAPTILDILGIEKPQEMTGKSILPFL
jgi:2,3-bisphosphoglycerate-independent phosphoglycerate mutase